MTIKRPDKLAVIDIDGPDGNAFAIMGYAARLARNDPDMDWPSIQEEMMSGDYMNLLRVFDREFGDLVEIVTTQENILEELGNA